MRAGEVIKVYIGDISRMDQESCRELMEIMPQSRIDKINKYKQDVDKKRSLAAMSLLINAARECGLSDFELAEADNGKPYFINSPDLHFNLSHSGQRVMCAMDEMPLGCDIQEMGSLKLEIAKRFFTPDEYNLLLYLKSKEEQKNMFYRLWTLKEAYIKATGEGLTRELNSFSFDIELNSHKLVAGINTEGYVFFEGARDNYRYAICSINKILKNKPIAIEEIVF